jgi:hypothetical protein
LLCSRRSIISSGWLSQPDFPKISSDRASPSRPEKCEQDRKAFQLCRPIFSRLGIRLADGDKIQIAVRFQFPDSGEDDIIELLGVGQSERVSAMTKKVITMEFVVPTMLAIALGIVFSMGAVYLTDIYLGPIDQAEAHYPAAAEQ